MGLIWDMVADGEVWILLFVVILVGVFVGVILAINNYFQTEYPFRKGVKPSSEKVRKLQDYERDYLARQGIKSTKRKPATKPKPAEARESENNFCDNCGKSLRPTAKFCGSCGTSVP